MKQNKLLIYTTTDESQSHSLEWKKADKKIQTIQLHQHMILENTHSTVVTGSWSVLEFVGEREVEMTKGRGHHSGVKNMFTLSIVGRLYRCIHISQFIQLHTLSQLYLNTFVEKKFSRKNSFNKMWSGKEKPSPGLRQKFIPNQVFPAIYVSWAPQCEWHPARCWKRHKANGLIGEIRDTPTTTGRRDRCLINISQSCRG